MKFTNKHVSNLEPYKLASQKIWEYNDDNKILKLDWNEATISASPLVKKMVLETIDKIGFRYYPDVNNRELKRELSKYTGLNEDSIQYFASSDSAHEYIAKTFLDNNDNVLILGPTYDNLRITCQSMGCNIFFAEYNNGYIFSEEKLISSIDSLNPKLVYLCNPNNPTGSIIELESIERLVSKYADTLFVIDEAYYEFYGYSSSGLVKKYNNIIVSRTFSKAFAIANFRIGYLLANTEILESINRIRNAKNITSLSQSAAIAALKDVNYMESYVYEVRKSKEQLFSKLSEIISDRSVIYNGEGNFILINFHNDSDKKNILMNLNKHDVFVRDMSHVEELRLAIRITIGTRKQMEKVINIFKECFI